MGAALSWNMPSTESCCSNSSIQAQQAVDPFLGIYANPFINASHSRSPCAANGAATIADVSRLISQEPSTATHGGAAISAPGRSSMVPCFSDQESLLVRLDTIIRG